MASTELVYICRKDKGEGIEEKHKEEGGKEERNTQHKSRAVKEKLLFFCQSENIFFLSS